MEMTVVTLLFQGIPEIIALVIFILAFNDDLKEWKKGVVIGIILAVLIFFIRKLQLSFGFHTFLAASICFIIMYLLFNIDIIRLIKGLLIGTILVFIGEEVSFGFLLILNFAPQEIMNNKFLWILSGWLNFIFLMIITLLLYIKNKKKC
jgi:hypothetical protein